MRRPLIAVLSYAASLLIFTAGLGAATQHERPTTHNNPHITHSTVRVVHITQR